MLVPTVPIDGYLVFPKDVLSRKLRQKLSFIISACTAPSQQRVHRYLPRKGYLYNALYSCIGLHVSNNVIGDSFAPPADDAAPNYAVKSTFVILEQFTLR